MDSDSVSGNITHTEDNANIGNPMTSAAYKLPLLETVTFT
jgi:hypothetical protein